MASIKRKPLFISDIQSRSFRGTTHCSEHGKSLLTRSYSSYCQGIVAKLEKWSARLLAGDVRRSVKTCKQAFFESARFDRQFFFFCSVFGAEVNQHSRTSPTQTQGVGGGRRDPGCYGKGHPDFTLMDSSDSVAEEELSWAPWQQATDG